MEYNPYENIRELVSLLKFEFAHITGQELHNSHIAEKIDLHPSSLSRALNENLQEDRVSLYFNKIQRSFKVKLKVKDGRPFLEKEPGSPLLENFSTNEHHFIYYYLPRQNAKTFNIAKAILRINRKAATASLTFFSRENPNIKNEKNGKVIELDGQLIFLFEDKNTKGLEKQLPSMNYFAGGWNSLNNQIMVGTYVATGPSCGLALAEKCSKDQLEKKLQTQIIPPVITALLREKRIEPQSGLRLATDFSEIKASTLINQVAKYEGVYSAFILESRPSREEIHELVLEIYDGCRFRFKSRHSGEHEGYIVDYYNRTIICYFGYRQSKGYFRNSMIINLDPNRARNALSPDLIDMLPEKSFIGIYSGVEGDNYPIGGRILLVHADKKYSDFEPTPTRLDKFNQVNQLLKKRPYLLPFLRGELDKYIDSPALLEKYKLLNTSTSQNYPDKQSFFPFEGIYFIYRLSTDGKVIYKKPIRIHETGTVTIIGKDEDGKGFNFKGNAQYWKDSYLSINLYEREWKPFFVYHVFYVGADMPEINDFFVGISSSFTSTNKLRASREVLIKTDHKSLSGLYYDKIPTNPFDPANHKLKALEQSFPGLAHYLTGNAENQIITPRELNPLLKREENFGFHFFTSACYQLKEGAPPEEVIALLKKALLHGFNNFELLEKEINSPSGWLNHPDVKQQFDLKNLKALFDQA